MSEAAGSASAPRLVFAEGRECLAVRGEDATILTVELPPAGRRQLREMLPFAVEDRLGAPLDDVHTVLGPRLGDGRFICAAAAHEKMAEWTLWADAENLSDVPLVPEQLLLPIPQSGWLLTAAAGERVLVRCADGTGLAASRAELQALWELAGSPPASHRGASPPSLIPSLPVPESELPSIEPVPLDLRTGLYAPRRDRVLPVATLTRIAAGGLAALLVLFIADTFAVAAIAEDRQEETRALLASEAPQLTGSDDSLFRLIESSGAASGSPDLFLPLLAETTAALSSVPALTVTELRYDRTEGDLIMAIEAESFVAIQTAEAAVSDAGLSVSSGTASATPGGAEAELTVSRRGDQL